ncbi:D-2-hydroxyglutarate mitochondrial [Brachionus plicatilis]|uniref:D-2-hydroxyglutarate dehydrogenase, mitochondrial n=1 Tax=Brachionus plicatilis TaxID=10195 RepID=A0A3M7PW33_BRAPC|nr:D-2-hydroxyglutarate mitochondrial [Brachionus plicatilis]
MNILKSRCKIRKFSFLIQTRNLALKRFPNYSILTDKDYRKNRCLDDVNSLDSYNEDWLKSCKGNSKLVLLPKTTLELSEILKYCYAKNLAICPQGGNTGLVGGSVPVFDEIIISTRLMNQIIKLDEESSILSCQSGCILQNLDDYVSQRSLIMPLDLGAKGSCHIGGNVSTNAGGLRLLRYGSLKGNVLGLEVVLSNGEILNSMNVPLRKDNTGFDTKQIFIGSEGQLGFISGVSILCPPRPRAANLILVACNGKSFQNVIQIFKTAKLELNEILSAFEFMDRESMRAVKENSNLENPFSIEVSEKCDFYCLVETHSSDEESALRKIENFYSKLSEKDLGLDCIVAENKTQFSYIWSLRERIAESLTKDGHNYKYDISLPLNKMYDLVIDIRKRFSENDAKNYFRRCIGYGHLGDSNLHLNVTSEKYDEKIFKLLEPFLYEWTMKNNGSISAEHGLGLKKKNYIYYSKTKENVEYMRKLKKLFDPKLLLNPYKTLPDF